MEQDNKKERSKAKKARNEQIRVIAPTVWFYQHLVDFVKKRDKRVIEAQKEAARQEEERKKREEIQKKERVSVMECFFEGKRKPGVKS